ncbi:PilN domain-containing protein [Bacillus kwashiorkori]|uniref:PilN domain-containing protein n=1 Tax=Bacillus kwashiorkori TaxID=1522318 RepID=UPI00078134B4|nr:PilN domain-containing protein [Bacillus kwashiorkori]
MLPEINLLPKYEKENSIIQLIVLIFIILWALLLSFIVFQYFQTKSDKQVLDQRIETLTLEKSTLETKLTNQNSEEKATLADAVNYAQMLTAPTSKLVEELLALLPENSYLSSYSYGSSQLSVQTQFESLDIVATYVRSLVASPFFTDVKVNNISTFTIEEVADSEEKYDTIPRYDVSFSLSVNRSALVLEDGGEDHE